MNTVVWIQILNDIFKVLISKSGAKRHIAGRTVEGRGMEGGGERAIVHSKTRGSAMQSWAGVYRIG